ncbi:MAG: hypothetical protein K5769_11280 [Pseudobutyrivibrio sp.]|nr:hypothetical protein [Pseudobutyrivibrio sp.]
MPDDYRGPHIFKHRYIGLSEEDIRGEIDRLQGELYAMETALDFFSKDNKEIKEQLSETQQANEKLLKSLDTRVQNLQDSLDYGAPIKAQIDAATKDFTNKMDAALNAERIKRQERSMSALTKLVVLNTVLVLVAVGLVVYSIFFI